MSRRVVITGLGTVNALANNVADFHSALAEFRRMLMSSGSLAPPWTRFSECLLQDPRYFSLMSLDGLHCDSRAKKPSIQGAQKLGQGLDLVDCRDYEAALVAAVRQASPDNKDHDGGAAPSFASTSALGEMARASFGPWRKWAKRLDRFAVLGVMASAEALQDAGLSNNVDTDTSEKTSASRAFSSFDPFRASVLVSNMGLHLGVHERNQKIIYASTLANCEPLYVLNGISNTVTGIISQIHQLRGPTFNCNAGNASSLASLQAGKLFIEQDMSDICLVGACESPLSKSLVWVQKNCMGPNKIFGEGAGVLCLEEREHALRRGAHVYAELLSTALNSHWEPSARGEALVPPDSEQGFDQAAWNSLAVPKPEAIADNLHRCLSQVLEQRETGDKSQEETEAELQRKFYGSWQYVSHSPNSNLIAAREAERETAHSGQNQIQAQILDEVEKYLRQKRLLDGATVLRGQSVQNVVGDCLSATGAMELIGALCAEKSNGPNSQSMAPSSGAKNILCSDFGWGGHYASALLQLPSQIFGTKN